MSKQKKIILIIVVLAIIIIGGVFGYKCIKENQSTGTDWGDKYLDFMQDMSNGDNRKMLFIETDFYDDPMLIAYDDIGNDMSKFAMGLYVIENGKVKKLPGLVTNVSQEIKFMYDVEKNKYNYFLYENFDGSKTYESIDSIIIDNKVNDIVSEEGLSQEDRNKREDEEYSKYDNYSKYFISVMEDPDKEFSYVVDTGMKVKVFDYKRNPEYLFKTVSEFVRSYKKNKDLGIKYDDAVQEKLKNVSKGNAKEPEQEKVDFAVGKYTLKYGKYRACFDASTCSEFTLNPDGTAIFDGKTKYFRVENYNFAQGVIESQTGEGVYPSIIISDAKNGTGTNIYTPYVSTPDCLMTDGEIECVVYIGE